MSLAMKVPAALAGLRRVKHCSIIRASTRSRSPAESRPQPASCGQHLDGDLADGFFIAPTVFGDVDPASDLGQNKVFGPVLANTKFTTDRDAIDIAN